MGGMWCKIHIYIRACLWEHDTYHICDQRRLRRACASAQSRQSLRCSLVQHRGLEEGPGKEPHLWPFWVARQAFKRSQTARCSRNGSYKILEQNNNADLPYLVVVFFQNWNRKHTYIFFAWKVIVNLFHVMLHAFIHIELTKKRNKYSKYSLNLRHCLKLSFSGRKFNKRFRWPVSIMLTYRH